MTSGQEKIYEMATERIIAELEKGIIPWQKPWTGARTGAYNYITGRTYCLMNQFMLNHKDGYVTFNQAKKAGGHVKKGAKSEIVFEWIVKSYQKKDENGDPMTDEDGNPVMYKRISLTYDKVFWIGDCEGLPVKERNEEQLDPVEAAENIIADYVQRSGVKFHNDSPSNEAFYAPGLDSVTVPMISQYKNVGEYYSTTFHELTHSTGHKSRLNRFEENGASAAFGSETYSKEELVAELGAATLVNFVGLENEKSFRNSAAYIQSWLKVLKNDKKFIISTSAKAEKAVALILNK